MGVRVGGFVLLQMRAHRLLIAAALLTVLLTTAVLAALAGFTSAAGDAGVRRTLQTTDAAGTPLLLTDYGSHQGNARADATARTLATRAFAGLPYRISSLPLSDPLSLPAAWNAAPGAPSDGTALAPIDRTEVRLLSGSWPGAASTGGDTVPVAVPVAAADRLGRGGAAVQLGTVLKLTDLVNQTSLRIRVTGIYQPRNSNDGYWQLDPEGGKGAQLAANGSQYGPLLIPGSDFASGAATQFSMTWQATADFSTVRASGLGALAAADSGVLAALNAQSDPAFTGFSATSVLPELIGQLQQNVLVARSTLLVIVLELVLLAVLTLLRAARLLAEERESESALLRARGAAPRQLAALAAAEALLLVLPAVVLSPLLAGPLIRLISDYGPLAASGVRLDGPLPHAVWWAAGAGAFCSALALLAPTLVRARSWSEHRQRRNRRGALPGLLRGGADLVLVALAAAACWQLTGHASGSSSGALNANGQGTLGIDPVLVAAPALALAAGTVLTLRLLPLAARAADRIAARVQGLPAALVGWQLSRRPQQSSGPILAIVLAAAIGTLALGQSASWHQSQLDQAVFNTGGDLRIADSTGNAFGQGGTYGSLPGVAAAVPVARQTLTLGSGRTAELLALDTRTEAGLLSWRSDLRSAPVAGLLGPLSGTQPPAALRGIALPGRPSVISLDVSAELTSSQAGAAVRMTAPDDKLLVTVTDRYGLGYTLGPLTLPTDGATHTLQLNLAQAAAGGVPAYPLTVTGIVVDTPVSTSGIVQQQLTVRRILSGSTPATVPAAFHWTGLFDPGQSIQGLSSPTATTNPPNVYHAGSLLSFGSSAAAPLTAALGSGTVGSYDQHEYSAPSGTLTFTASGAVGGGPLPAVATKQFLAATNAHIGSVLPLNSAPGGVEIRIIAAVTAIPGTGAAAEQGINGSALVNGTGYAASSAASDGGAVLVDLAAYDRAAAATADDQLLQPSEWWLYVRPAAGRSIPATENQVAGVLRALPDVQTFYSLDQVESTLTSDPLGTGPEAALLAGIVLAAILAAISFSADATAIARHRAGDNAVLKALGTPQRLIARSTAAQLALPTLVGLGAGLILGTALAQLVVPEFILTAQATRPVPPVQVVIPDGRLALLLAAVAAVPLLVAAVSGLRGTDPAQRLRQPEES